MKFGAIGQIEARKSKSGRISPFGRATIKVCGLDRPSLREARLEKARKTFVLIDRLEDENNPQRVQDAIDDLVEMGREDTMHCGMVRAIVEEVTDLPWSELEDKGNSSSD